MARQADESSDTLELEFEQVCQPVAPQVTQLWYKNVDNSHVEVANKTLKTILNFQKELISFE